MLTTTTTHAFINLLSKRARAAASLPNKSNHFRQLPSHHRFLSNLGGELGIRSTLPPDSMIDPPHPPNKDSQDISDQEWELRTGRAIYLLTQTLPDFFSTGLIDSPTKLETNTTTTTSVVSPAFDTDVESIYSSKIRLEYTPPIALPSPFPKTLHVEGLPLYLASSVFVRHTLKALYSDLHVELRKVSVNTPSSSSPHPPLTHPKRPDGDEDMSSRISQRRDKCVFIGLCVHGIARVSGGAGQWEVNSTYTFSPKTGLIREHRIDSIHPAPHQAVYDALRASLINVFGLGHPKGARADAAAFGGGPQRTNARGKV